MTDMVTRSGKDTTEHSAASGAMNFATLGGLFGAVVGVVPVIAEGIGRDVPTPLMITLIICATVIVVASIFAQAITARSYGQQRADVKREAARNLPKSAAP